MIAVSLAGAAVLVTVGVVAIGPRLRATGAAADPAIPRVMVMPWENRTDDGSLDPLGLLVADWVADGLARIPAMRVVPGSVVLEALEAAHREGAGPTLARMAALTGAGIAVTGSFYRRGEDLEFHSEVVEVATGAPLTSVHPIRGRGHDPREAIDSVRIKIMGALAARLTENVAWEFPPFVRPPTYEAFMAYSTGLEYWGVGDWGAASEAFLRAYRLDTTYVRSLMLASGAAANGGDRARGDSLFELIEARRDRLTPYDRHRLEYASASRRGDRTAALAAARAGVEIAPWGTLHAALALALQRDNRLEEALANTIEIMTHNPASRRWYQVWLHRAELLHRLGRHEEALEIVEEGLSISAGGRLTLLGTKGRALAGLGRAEELEWLIEEVAVTAAQPESSPGEVLLVLAGEAAAHGLDPIAARAVEAALGRYAELPEDARGSDRERALLANVLYRAGRWEEAAEVTAELQGSLDDIDILGRLGAVKARRGDVDGARRASEGLLGAATAPGQADLWRARIAAILGEGEAATALLRKAFATGVNFGLWVHTDPDLAPLRGDPAFEELVRPRG